MVACGVEKLISLFAQISLIFSLSSRPVLVWSTDNFTRKKSSNIEIVVGIGEDGGVFFLADQDSNMVENDSLSEVLLGEGVR